MKRKKFGLMKSRRYRLKVRRAKKLQKRTGVPWYKMP